MHIAAYHGYVEIVQLLLAAGAGEYADLVDKVSDSRALKVSGSLCLTEFMLHACMVCPWNCNLQSGKTALDLARKNNHHATSALLDPYTVVIRHTCAAVPSMPLIRFQ